MPVLIDPGLSGPFYPLSHHRMRKNLAKDLPIIGWREWVGLPQLNIDRIKVKVDTGARTSALHASRIRSFTREGQLWVHFQVHPLQRETKTTIEAEAQVLEYRPVRSSNGKTDERPVIVTDVLLLGVRWPVELTLASRDAMGFRMLLGREAIRQRFLVDSGNSFYAARPKRKKRPRADFDTRHPEPRDASTLKDSS